jgi:hypothetical protein
VKLHGRSVTKRLDLSVDRLRWDLLVELGEDATQRGMVALGQGLQYVHIPAVGKQTNFLAGHVLLVAASFKC